MSAYIQSRGWHLRPVGSRVTCDPAPTDTDQDYLVLVPRKELGETIFQLQREGWELGGSIDDDSTSAFASLRKGAENILLTDNLGFYNRFIAATSIAKRFNLLDKDDRIALFQAVLYGNSDGQTS